MLHVKRGKGDQYRPSTLHHKGSRKILRILKVLSLTTAGKEGSEAKPTTQSCHTFDSWSVTELSASLSGIRLGHLETKNGSTCLDQPTVLARQDLVPATKEHNSVMPKEEVGTKKVVPLKMAPFPLPSFVSKYRGSPSKPSTQSDLELEAMAMP
ncbi:hypothetical protein AMTR_s00051p00143530 [Amborella trichopoda]|uniref:Uncharacterized protein n=1 Tax=Amborella trichopoda TaxID=13333 RepID=U5CTQ4_AMBTC|nr:hypothetical protein AMTR_s00051p00143530 [Amborella trichopoda]